MKKSVILTTIALWVSMGLASCEKEPLQNLEAIERDEVDNADTNAIDRDEVDEDDTNA